MLDDDMQLPEEEFEQRFPFPHCDGAILHSPGSCIYCDKYPSRQQYRVESNTNFSDKNDSTKLPCPSTYTRSAESRDRWYGNQAQPPE